MSDARQASDVLASRSPVYRQWAQNVVTALGGDADEIAACRRQRLSSLWAPGGFLESLITGAIQATREAAAAGGYDVSTGGDVNTDPIGTVAVWLRDQIRYGMTEFDAILGGVPIEVIKADVDPGVPAELYQVVGDAIWETAAAVRSIRPDLFTFVDTYFDNGLNPVASATGIVETLEIANTTAYSQLATLLEYLRPTGTWSTPARYFTRLLSASFNLDQGTRNGAGAVQGRVAALRTWAGANYDNYATANSWVNTDHTTAPVGDILDWIVLAATSPP